MKSIRVILILMFIQMQGQVNKSFIVDNGSGIFTLTNYSQGKMIYKYTSFSDVEGNNTPEQALRSTFSEQSLDWYNYNHIVKKDSIDPVLNNKFSYNKNVNNHTLWYYELLQKIVFSINNKSYCIIKVCYHNPYENDGVLPVVVKFFELDKTSNKWYRRVRPVDGDTSVKGVLFSFNDFSYLKLMDIANEEKGKNAYLDDILNRVYDNGVLNFSSLYRLFLEFKNEEDNLKNRIIGADKLSAYDYFKNLSKL